MLLAALFSLARVLSFPMPLALVSDSGGHDIAYVLDESGVRSLWFASAPGFAPRKLWDSKTDDGQELTNLVISSDGKYVVYVRGGSHDANWTVRPWPNPANSPKEPHLAVLSIPTAGGDPKVLGEGDIPVVSPDSATVAFIHDGDSAVWSAPIDGSTAASKLFFDRGQDAELQYAPDGKALAFTSNRDDHSFIGIYRDRNTPVEYLAPSTSHDSMPRWSPDGTQIAFIRTPGDGGAPPNLLVQQPQPWQIWVAGVGSAKAHPAWTSGKKLRDSYPGINGPQLNWLAGNRLVFVSEKSNWPNLYEVPATGGPARDISSGSFMVEDTSVATDKQSVYYTANTGSEPGDIARRHIFRAYAGGPTREIVTKGSDSQWWPAALASGVAYVNAGARVPFTIAVQGRNINADRIPADFPTADLTAPQLVNFRASDGWKIQGTLFEHPGGAAKKPAAASSFSPSTIASASATVTISNILVTPDRSARPNTRTSSPPHATCSRFPTSIRNGSASTAAPTGAF